jgi:CheY-like chemotaxis protein
MTTGEPRILSVVVVDDEPDVAAYLAAVLERHGHRAHTARSAAEGFDLIKGLLPDVACIDIVMPEETGVALVRRIRADPEVADTPVVFITALRPEMTTPDGAGQPDPALAANGYIEKPPDAAVLLETIVEAAARRGRSR